MESDQPNTRYFQLQLKASCQLNCSYCPGLGLVASKDLIHQDLLLSLKKARSGGYTAILIPCNALDSVELPIVIETVRTQGFSPIIQINSRQLLNMKVTIDAILAHKVGIQVLMGNNTSIPDAIWLNLKQKSESFFVTIIAHKRMHALEAFRSLPDWVKKSAYFHFPYQMDEADEFFTPESIYEFLKRFRIQFSGYKVLPSPGVDIFDRQTPPGVDLELMNRPFFVSKAARETKQNPLYSVIIPSQNNWEPLKATLKSLNRQTLGLDQFEVVIIEHGTKDVGLKSLVEFIKSELPQMRVQILRLFFQNSSGRDKRQSAQSLALNLGVKNAQGDHLFFLGSSSLTPPNLLEKLLFDHEKGDLVQARRMVIPADLEWNDTDPWEGTMLDQHGAPENHFWAQFYKGATQWNQLTDGWRYVSGSQLSVRRDVFEYVGWFRKSFSLSGFEDSEFAYRAKKKGFQFHLSQAKVFQKAPSKKEVSNFLRWHRDRHWQQPKSAKVFFQNNLDIEVYEQLQSFL